VNDDGWGTEVLTMDSLDWRSPRDATGAARGYFRVGFFCWEKPTGKLKNWDNNHAFLKIFTSNPIVWQICWLKIHRFSE